jgi:ClpP class serine protease
MNYALAREIYGGGVWMVDQMSFTTLSAMLKDFRSGVQSDNVSEKLNSIARFNVLSNSTVTADSATDVKKEPMVSVITINGPIIKNGGMSSRGMDEISAMLMLLDKDDNIIGHVIMADSGGGSAAGMEIMQHALDSATKPTATVVTRGGMAGSAMYGIAAHTGRIFAETEKVEVGSIGTLISFKAQPDKSINVHGEKQVTIYADASTEKNKWFIEAVNNDDYKLAKEQILNPHANDFREDMRSKRPGVTDAQLNGSVYKAKDTMGVLVDEIGGLAEAVAYIKVENEKTSNKLTLNNKNKKAMKADEIKSQHPESYTEIFNAGANSERERVKTWQVFAGVDQEAVNKGIASGLPITESERSAFLLKAASSQKLADLADGSPGAVVTEQAAAAGAKVSTEDEKEFESIYGKHSVTLNANPSLN